MFSCLNGLFEFLYVYNILLWIWFCTERLGK